MMPTPTPGDLIGASADSAAPQALSAATEGERSDMADKKPSPETGARGDDAEKAAKDTPEAESGSKDESNEQAAAAKIDVDGATSAKLDDGQKLMGGVPNTKPIVGSASAEGPLDVDKTPFPVLLHEIVSDPTTDDCIHWMPCGTRFMISDKKKFANEVLPRYYGNAKYTSFTRRLKRWAFARIPSGPFMGAYYNPNFRKGETGMASTVRYDRPSPIAGELQKARLQAAAAAMGARGAFAGMSGGMGNQGQDTSSQQMNAMGGGMGSMMGMMGSGMPISNEFQQMYFNMMQSGNFPMMMNNPMAMQMAMAAQMMQQQNQGMMGPGMGGMMGQNSPMGQNLNGPMGYNLNGPPGQMGQMDGSSQGQVSRKPPQDGGGDSVNL
ncbi:hypothetical protein ACHAWF_009823 [Thalassiosira exigua]